MKQALSFNTSHDIPIHHALSFNTQAYTSISTVTHILLLFISRPHHPPLFPAHPPYNHLLCNTISIYTPVQEAPCPTERPQASFSLPYSARPYRPALNDRRHSQPARYPHTNAQKTRRRKNFSRRGRAARFWAARTVWCACCAIHNEPRTWRWAYIYTEVCLD